MKINWTGGLNQDIFKDKVSLEKKEKLAKIHLRISGKVKQIISIVNKLINHWKKRKALDPSCIFYCIYKYNFSKKMSTVHLKNIMWLTQKSKPHFVFTNRLLKFKIFINQRWL